MGILRPQILTEERVLASFVSPAGARVAAMVGSAQWGPLNEVINITNMSEFVSTFGDDSSSVTLTLIKGADNFFRNGGTLKVVRIEDGNAEQASLVLNNGTTPVLTVKGFYKGHYGNNITVAVSANPVNAGNRNILITDGTSVERYTNAGQGFTTNQAIADEINAVSSLVEVTVSSGQGATNLVDVTTATQLSGGLSGEASLSNANYTDVLDNQLLMEDYNFLLIPGMTDDAFHSTVVGKLNARADNEKKYARYITGIGLNESITTATSRTAAGRRISVVAPNLKYTNRVTGVVEYLDGSYLACVYSGMLCRTDIQVSGTHENLSLEGIRVNASTNQIFYNKAEQEALLEGRIIPVTKIGNTIQASRGVTRVTNTTEVFFDEVVVDIVDFVKSQVERYLETTIGKPNTPDRRVIYSSRVDAILNVAQRQEIIEEFQSTIVTAGASPDILAVTVGIKPTYNTNFVLFTININ